MKHFLFALFLLTGIDLAAQQNSFAYWDAQGNYIEPYTFGAFNIKYYDQQTVWRESGGPRFNCYLSPVGLVTDGTHTGLSFGLNLGVRTTKYFYAGLETGLDMMKAGIGRLPKDNYTYSPLALNVMGLLPVGKRFCPYVQASAGAYFGIQGLSGSNGFYADAKLGAEYRL